MTIWNDNYYAHRRDWAFETEKRFKEHINKDHPDLKAYFERSSDEVTVSVYGLTQVGKTSLILSLLGVTCPAAENVLRGGQKLGNSSTASPIRYYQSEDNFWRIQKSNVADVKKLNRHDAKKEFKEIREAVEDGKSNVEFEKSNQNKELIVSIPKNYFGENNFQGKKIRILDIPGTGAKNENEQAFVGSITKDFVVLSDLILLVGTVNGLDFLSKLENEDLKKWWMQPNRYRIILTYTFSDESSKEKIKEYCSSIEEASNKDDEIRKKTDEIRNYIFEQIGTFEKEVFSSEEIKKIIYPMELGKSLKTIEDTNSRSMIDYFRKELIADINKASNPYTRVCSIFEFSTYVKNQQVVDEEAHTKTLQKIDEEVKELNKKCESIQKHIDNQKSNLKLIDEIIQRLNHISSESEKIKSFEYDAAKIRSDKTVSNLENFIETECENTINCVEGFLFDDNDIIHLGFNEWQRGVFGDIKNKINQDVRKQDILMKLNNYRLDGYWIDDNFNWDFYMICEIISEIKKDSCEYIKEASKSNLDGLKKQSDKLMSDIQSYESLMNEWIKQKDKKDNEAQKICFEYDELKKKIQHTIDYADEFLFELEDEFLKQVNTVKNLATNAPSATERLFNLLYLPALFKEYETFSARHKDFK